MRQVGRFVKRFVRFWRQIADRSDFVSGAGKIRCREADGLTCAGYATNGETTGLIHFFELLLPCPNGNLEAILAWSDRTRPIVVVRLLSFVQACQRRTSWRSLRYAGE